MKRVTKYGTYYGVHEVYYDSEGKVEGYTPPVSVVGESIEEIKQYLEMILNCLDKDILDYDDEEKKNEILRQKIEEGLNSDISDYDLDDFLENLKNKPK